MTVEVTSGPIAPETFIHPAIKLASERPLYVKMLVYGASGVGKTYLCCTAPDCLVLLTEPSVADATLRAFARDRGVHVPVWDVSSGDELDAAYEYLAGGRHPFKTVVVDGLTDINQRVKRAVIQASIERARKRGREHDPDTLEEGDWGRVMERMSHIIQLFRDLPMHVVMTALAVDVRNESRRVPFLQPRSVAERVPAYFNCVAYLTAYEANGVVVRKLYTEGSEAFLAKNPGKALPTVVENPDLGRIFPAVLGALKNEESLEVH